MRTRARLSRRPASQRANSSVWRISIVDILYPTGYDGQGARADRSIPEWKKRYPGETPAAPVFIDGKKAVTLRGPTVAADLKQMVIDYIERRFGQGGAGRTAAE